MYAPAAAHGARLLANSGEGAEQLAAWKQRVRERWDGVRILAVRDAPRGVDPASPLRLHTEVQLAGLAPEDLRVEFRAQRLLPEARHEPPLLCSFGHGLPDGQWCAQLQADSVVGADGAMGYSVAAAPPGTGQYQLQVRVYPWHPLLTHPLELGLMKTL
jgi:glycogen phosphorylase